MSWIWPDLLISFYLQRIIRSLLQSASCFIKFDFQFDFYSILRGVVVESELNFDRMSDNDWSIPKSTKKQRKNKYKPPNWANYITGIKDQMIISDFWSNVHQIISKMIEQEEQWDLVSLGIGLGWVIRMGSEKIACHLTVILVKDS